MTNKSADDCVKNNKNNITSTMEHSGTGLFKERTPMNIISDTGDVATQVGSVYTPTKKHSYQPQVLLARENQVGGHLTLTCRPTSDKMNQPSKESVAVNDRTTREVSSYIGSSGLGMAVEHQEGKAASVLNQDSERHAAHPMGSLNEKESLATNNTATIEAIPENSINLPDYITTLDEGKSVCGDTHVPFSKPDWLDMEKFQRGQRFGIKHSFGVMFADVMSLMMLFAFRGGLEPLIFTGKSDTPFKAFKRYLSTVTRVMSWYEGDIWDEHSEAHKNLKAVRGMHDSVRKNMESASREEVAKRVTLENRGDSQPMWTDLKEEILDDFRSSCPFSRPQTSNQKVVYINQCDMAVTQFGFLGLLLLFPKKFGIHYASEEDFEGFVHFWRVIGYLLGTGDRFNLCNGELKTVRQRCSDIIHHWVKPELRELSGDWIHMSRCVYKGLSFYIPTVEFESVLLYLCRMLDIKAVKLAASCTFWQYCRYLNLVFFYCFTLRLPGMYRLFNRLADFGIKVALNMSPEHLMRLRQWVYPSNATSMSL